MNPNTWNKDLEEITPQELTEEEKKLAEAYAEIELEYLDTICKINTDNTK